MRVVMIVHVAEVDGSGHKFIVEAREGVEIGAQSRQIYSSGATETLGDDEWTFWPPHRIVKIEVRNVE